MQTIFAKQPNPVFILFRNPGDKLGFPEIRGPLLGGVAPRKKELTTLESICQPPGHGKYMKLLIHDGVVTGACHSMTVISFTL